MKKKVYMGLLAIAMLALMTACGDSMSYSDYNLDEYLTVGDYKGLTVEPYVITVTSDEIDAAVEDDLEAAATKKDLDKKTALKEGDTVNIDYEGKMNGKTFDGGSATGYDLELGSGTFISGFEDGLVGHKIGDTVKLNLTFPDNYSKEEYQGKDVVFTVIINSATRDVTPSEADYVKDSTDYNSVSEYEASVKKELYDNKESEAIQTQKESLWSDALSNTEVNTYPERELKHYMEFNSEQIDTDAKTNGVSRSEMLEQYEFSDEDEFAAVNEDSSKLRIKQEMLLEYIADKEGLTCTDDDIDLQMSQFEDSGYDASTIKEQTGRPALDYARIQVLYDKVLSFLLDNAKITGGATEY